MWVPSFWSVLHDLWCFFWRIEQSADRLTNHVFSQASLPLSNRLITLDTSSQPKMQLQVGELYTDESVETIVIRKKLQAHNELIVQSGNLSLIEWLLYMVTMQNSDIALLALRMSPIGFWYQTLKGLPGVTVEIRPSTGALIEWVDYKKESHAGFVERVSPNNMITVRTVSQVPSGTYAEHLFTEQVWKEQGSVFTRFR